MPKSRPLVVVTGARSHLGCRVVRHLLESTGSTVAAIASPWSERPPFPDSERLVELAVDLTESLDARTAALFADAARVFHFAWIRGRDQARVRTLNEGMAERIVRSMSTPSGFCFISSVAAAPSARSVYARTKWHVASLVRASGGSVAVCGLVIDDPPRGPYGTLRHMVDKLPVSIRLIGKVAAVYPVALNDLAECMRVISQEDLPPDSYRVFSDQAVEMNRFVEMLEAETPRFRILIPLPANLVVLAGQTLRPLAPAVLERLLTFLHKDEKLLAGLAPVPRVSFATFP
jgi:nucleoside-diphosphate-sugar epimerase